MDFETITSNYLNDLRDERKSAELSAGYTDELSYKPVLHTYFKSIAGFISEYINVIFEPSTQGDSGRPDWRFYDKKSLGNFGYIEGKGLSWTSPIEISQYRHQIDKYLGLKSNLILTDGVEFCFFGRSFEEQKHFCIIDKCSSDGRINVPATVLSDLEIAFRTFFKTPGFRHCSENEMIADAARRAKNLAEISLKLSDLPEGSGLNKIENDTITALHRLQELLQKHHDPALRDNECFVDFIAQVLVFGILYAHRFVTKADDTPVERLKKIKEFWIKPPEQVTELLPFHELMANLNKQFSAGDSAIGPLQSWYDDCCICMAHTQLKRDSKPDFHILYENFLRAYDPQKKIDTGSFYTPPVLADMMVRMSEYLAVSELKISSMFAPDNNIIDPCCGTGTFIEKIITNTISGPPVNISGFEIQPAPYALANYRIALLKEKYSFPHNVKIVLTNTLSDALEEQISDPCDLFDQEQLFAKELVRSPLILVIGNPPSSDAQKSHTPEKGFRIIQKLLDDFRPPEDARGARSNIQKQLQNDFMKFLRWACEKVLLNENGILAFVIPSSFFENPTYKYARLWMASKFNKIFLLKFDEDNRKGGGAKNLFQTLQGRAVLFAIRGNHLSGGECSFFFGDVSGLSVSEKTSMFEQPPQEIIKLFKRKVPDESLTLGLGDSAAPDMRAVYLKGVPLYPPNDSESRSVFLRHCSGVKLAPTALFVHPDKNILIRRCREIADQTTPPSAVVGSWFSGQSKPVNQNKLTPRVRLEFSSVVEDKKRINAGIHSYSFRPFLTSAVLLDEKLLAKMQNEGGGGTRLRPEVIQAFSDENNVGIAVAPSPKDIGTDLHRFVSFCWHIPDNDLCSRQNAHVFCAKFPDYNTGTKTARRPDNKNLSNISDELTGAGIDEVTWVFYSYAIMVSNWYLKNFSDLLYSSSDQIPRIPIHSDLRAVRCVARMGRGIADCENNETWEFGNDKFYLQNIDRFQDEFRLGKHKIGDEKLQLFVHGQNGIALEIPQINSSVLDLKVSGYGVISTWLKFKSYPYTRKTFGIADYKELLNLICAIRKQLALISRLDVFLEENFQDSNLWIV